MALVNTQRALLDTQRAFDGVAATYDRSNAENPLLCAMRTRARGALERVVPRGSRLLDLGCGPGTDVVYFAAHGYRVTAIDWSTAMVDEADRRIREAGLGRAARVLHLGIDQLDALDHPAADRFDAVYSNFGPLNCVTDLPRAACGIAAQLRSTGVLVASVIGRFCPWEMAVYAARGDLRRAFVRWSRRPVAVPLEGRTVWTQYYSPPAFRRVFERAGFETLSCRALGVLTPPPYLFPFAQRHAAFVSVLQRAEDVAGGWPGVRWLGDHFLIAMRKR